MFCIDDLVLIVRELVGGESDSFSESRNVMALGLLLIVTIEA